MQKQLSAILEASPDPMVMYDTNGHPLYLNPAFTQVFGWTFDELKNRVIPFVPEDQAELVAEKKELVYKNKEPVSFETRRCTKQGKELHMIISAAVILDEEGNACGMVTNLTDISEQKILEEQYEQAQRMKSLGTLAGGIAHDFNNYLSGILGYLDLARLEAGSENIQSYLTRAVESSERARALTHQLLTFSKGGAPVKEITHLGTFLEETTRFALSGSCISCAFHISKDLWACNCDKNQIGQVIDNLVINAQQAMPKGGDITLTAENLDQKKQIPDPDGPGPGKYVKISITDTGTGIAPELRKRIFDPFFSTRPTKGNGLGLATVYSIIKRHDGHITVNSKPGKGSTFHIFLPATGEATTPPSPTTGKKTGQPAIYRGKGRILIMDDDPIICEILTRMLERMDFSVIATYNGDQALEAFKTTRFQDPPLVAAILDLTIPGGKGGRETVKEIRKLDTDIPVFVASGYSEDDALSSPAAFGFTAGIKKPFLSTALEKMLKPHLP